MIASSRKEASGRMPGLSRAVDRRCLLPSAVVNGWTMRYGGRASAVSSRLTTEFLLEEGRDPSRRLKWRGLMRKVSIRELNSRLFQEAAERGEPVGVTNDRRLTAVLLPIAPGWVDQVVEDHFSRLVRSIDLGEKAVANGEPLGTWEDLKPSMTSGNGLPITRRVAIRELSGQLLAASAKAGEILGVLNDGELCAVLVPITPEWVDQMVDHNISRLVQSVEWGEKAVANGELLHTLESQEVIRPYRGT